MHLCLLPNSSQSWRRFLTRKFQTIIKEANPLQKTTMEARRQSSQRLLQVPSLCLKIQRPRQRKRSPKTIMAQGSNALFQPTCFSTMIAAQHSENKIHLFHCPLFLRSSEKNGR